MKKILKSIVFAYLFLIASNTVAQELIFDNHFQDGLKVYSPQYPPENPVKVDGTIGFDSTKTPVWTCAQWSSKSSLVDIPPIVLDNGWFHWSNTEKEVLLGPHGIEDYDLTLGVNSFNEYVGVYRELGESWPHLLVEQRLSPPNSAGPGSPTFDSLTSLDFHVEVKLEDDSTFIQSGYDKNIHAAQFLIYFTIQNLNDNSSGYGNEYVWLGLQIYDDRYERPSEYINFDDGTRSLIYSIAYDSLALESVHLNKWVDITVNLYPHAIKALNEAWQRGYLSSSQDLGDYKVGGMNMGWELPGMNMGKMKIRNISLIASNFPTEVQNKSKSEFGFSLSQNYPNPFNPSTTIKYSIPSTVISNLNRVSGEKSLKDSSPQQTTLGIRNDNVNVSLKVYDILGRELATLVNKKQNHGNYEIVFIADKLPSGIYYYELAVGNYSQTKKLVVLK